MRRRAAHLVRTARRRAADLAPPLRTALREVREHPAPVAASFRSFGPGSVVVPPARVRRPDLVDVGAGVVVHEGASILVADGAEGVRIGDGTSLSRLVHLACARSITIGRHVSTSDHATITDTWGPVPGRPGDPEPRPVVVGDGAYLGYGCIVGPGVVVGEGAFVGEGAVVVDDVPAHALVRGNPAVVVR